MIPPAFGNWRTIYGYFKGWRKAGVWANVMEKWRQLEDWVRGLKRTHKIELKSTLHQEGQGFRVVPWRWAVERTFAWLMNDRGHSRDDERLTVNSEAMIRMSMIRLLLKRLA